ncbi:MAG: hypothetical protein IJY26_01570 [Clostridia bacterium]|nr:hypothetical protein [Clostridia bacterium]
MVEIPSCKTARKMGGKELRSRTQILIDGNLGIDFPPDAYYHALRFDVDLSAIENLLVTHSHMDHFYAHDFILRGYKYSLHMTSPVLRIYGNEEVQRVFEECTRREMREEIQKTLPTSVIKPFEAYRVGEYTVTAFPALHSKVEQALLFLVEKDGKGYLHLHDTGMPPLELFEYLKEKGKKLHLVSLDCTFVDTPGPHSERHMGIEANAEVIKKLKSDGVADGNTKFVITHFSHNSAPFTERLKDIEKEYGVIAAYDGMTVEI